MELMLVLVIIVMGYLILLFFDMFFKSCAHYPYIQFLNGTGFQIKPFQIRWSTTAFNRLFIRWGATAQFYNYWFSAGLYVTLLLMPFSVIVLFVAIYEIFKTNAPQNNTPQFIAEPLVPGLTLPGSELIYYCASLVLCTVVHEVGHALSSVKEDVHILDVGINIFFILPVAYVNISSEKLNSLNPWRALRVLCAGVWHNIISVFIVYLIYLLLPFAYTPFFNLGEGVSVTSIANNSPLKGPKGIEPLDTITKINLCQITNESELFNCLRIVQSKKLGYCVSTDLVHGLDESVALKHSHNGVECCENKKQDKSCFEYIEKMDGILELPPHMCLTIRPIVEASVAYCNEKNICPQNFHCIKPILDNHTYLLNIERTEKPNIIYLGHPYDLSSTLSISDFIPKYIYSYLLYPEVVIKFLKYLIVFSSSLAIVNTIPCLFLDGQYISYFLLQIVLNKQPISNIKIISIVLSLCGALTLLLIIIYTIIQKLFII